MVITNNEIVSDTTLVQRINRELNVDFKDADTDRFLRALWPSLSIIGDDHGLEAYKLLNRTENVRLESPFIYFDIERHGATVNGSIYAEVHTWRVNLGTKEAEIIGISKRRLHKPSSRLDVKSLAIEIADSIVQRKDDSRLKWASENRVRLLIQEIIPATNAQTTTARRRRFYAALEPLLIGWKRENSFFNRAGVCEEIDKQRSKS
jgi:hypothetical protein